MKVIATQKAYFNGNLVRAGEILDVKICPTWAKKITEDAKNDKKNDKSKEVIFDELLTKALDKGIELDLENKTIDEKIALLNAALEKGNK